MIINGTAYIAPGGFHLKLKQLGENIVVQLEKSIQKCIHCPSVDVMFESAVTTSMIMGRLLLL